jgi:hypothetical protein
MYVYIYMSNIDDNDTLNDINIHFSFLSNFSIHYLRIYIYVLFVSLRICVCKDIYICIYICIYKDHNYVHVYIDKLTFTIYR